MFDESWFDIEDDSGSYLKNVSEENAGFIRWMELLEMMGP